MLRKTKRNLTAAAAVLAASAFFAGTGIFWFTHVYCSGRFYSRNTAALTFEADEIDRSSVQELQELLPDCEIRWQVPFQGTYYSSDTEKITVSHLTDEDVQTMQAFTSLTEVDGRACTDYAQLLELRWQHPGCRVRYSVPLGKTDWSSETAYLAPENVSGAETAEALQWLPAVDTVRFYGTAPSAEELESLQEQYPGITFQWYAGLRDSRWENTATEITCESEAEIEEIRNALSLLPDLQTADITAAGLTDEEAQTLISEYPDIEFIWELHAFGRTLRTDSTELDLSGAVIGSTAEVEDILKWFPDLQKVIMCDCGFDDETMAALNDQYEDIRFVWNIRMAGINVRTDDTWFAPVKYGSDMAVGDQNVYGLRYCTDMVCIDMGHMPITNCEWAAFMPNLKYLIIGDTLITDITPLAGLKNLVFLEMFKTQITDYTPLTTCTGLEDLNLGYTWGSWEPISKMTWLKNLWWASCDACGRNRPSWDAAVQLPQYLTTTNMVFGWSDSSTDRGWRHLDNYYAQRDYLGMFYMDG